MKRCAILWLLMLTWGYGFEPVTLIAPEGMFWCGEPVPVSIELRTAGRFDGVAQFQRPDVPETQWLRLGNPVVSSEKTTEGELFVQRHDFILISQQDGHVKVPEIPVRFGEAQGGETRHVEGKASAFTVQINRPPGVAPGEYVIAATEYEVTQSWSDVADKVDLGGVVTRTVMQKAEGISGMSFPPFPQAAPVGVRVYEPESRVQDADNRGALTGQRTDVLRYRMETPGKLLLPAVTFRWWNPETETLRTYQLEGRALRVKSELNPRRMFSQLFMWLGGTLMVLGVVWACRQGWIRIPNPVPPRRDLPPLNPGSE